MKWKMKGERGTDVLSVIWTEQGKEKKPKKKQLGESSNSAGVGKITP